jgi:fructose-1,6-bisphosphatase I
MFKAIPTLTDHILHDQQKYKHVTTGLHIVLLQIQNSSKIIASHVKASGLVDIIGKTGNINTFGEEVQKLDEFANNLLADRLLGSGYVHAIISEEEAKPRYASKQLNGEYVVCFDPLDGSQNIDVNMPIGTIFSIYHKAGGLLQKGEKQIAAGYILYGTSVMFVYTTGHGVNGFTLDPAIGSFLLSHPDITIPDSARIFSINEGYAEMYDPKIKRFVQELKDEKKFKGRFAGALVADAHRVLINGGIFLYPVNTNNPKGKLRLTIEVNPFSMLTEQAGGIAIGEDGKRTLLIEPKTIHDTASFIMGSKQNVGQFLKSLKK